MVVEKCVLFGEVFEILEFVKKIYYYVKEIKRLVMFMEVNFFVCDGVDVGIFIIVVVFDFIILIVGDIFLIVGIIGVEVFFELFFGYGLWISMKDIYYGGK